MQKGDAFCPLGFAPHSIRPTRCKRCFRDLKEHKTKDNSSQSPQRKASDTPPVNDKSVVADSTKASAIATPAEKDKASGDDNIKGVLTTNTAPTSTTVVRRQRPKLTDEDNGDDSSPATNATKRRVRERTRPGSWSYSENQASLDDGDSENAAGTIKSRRVQIVSAKELSKPSLVDEDTAIPETTSADVEFILQVKTSCAAARQSQRKDDDEDDDDDEDNASIAATETTITYHDAMEDMQSMVCDLQKQVDDWEKKYKSLEGEKKRVAPSTHQDKQQSEEVQKLRAQVRELKATNEDLVDDNKVHKLQVKELQEELDQRLSEKEVNSRLGEIMQRLRKFEATCEELTEENRNLKKEMEEMEEELDEMQDNFREEQVDEYRDLRKEMEQIAKNCRVLQFKLRKSERQCEQTSTEKQEVESRLSLFTNVADIDKVERISKLEAEVKAARQVSTHMQTEVETLRGMLHQVENERDAAQQKLLGKTGVENLKADVTSMPPKSQNVDSDNSAQLLRELYDTVEREKDLKEQLKFSEEEATSLHKKLTSVEEENESLMLQIKKLVASNRPQKAKRASGTPESDTDELGTDVATKLEVELLEQETVVLRRKITDLESDNETLHMEIRTLRCKDETKKEEPKLKPEIEPDAYYEQRIQLMELEAKELRRKLIDKERENEQLQVEVSNSSKLRRGSRAPMSSMQRSRSLDSDTQVDLRRQLQLIEQEAAILRQKTESLENDNEKLATENKKLLLQTGPKKKKVTQGTKQTLTTSETLKNSSSSKGTSTEDLDVGGTPVIKGQTSIVTYKQKTPRKIGENCTRPELKKYVSELEEEIRQMGITLGKAATTKTSSSPLPSSEENLKQELSQLKSTLEKTQTERQQLEDNIKNLTDKNSQLMDELTTERNTLTSKNLEIVKVQKTNEQLQSTVQNRKSSETIEISSLKKKTEALEKTLDEERQNRNQIREKIDSGQLVDCGILLKAKDDTLSLQKEVTEYQQKVTEIQKRLDQVTAKEKETTKAQKALRKSLDDTQKELDTERAKMKRTETKQADVAVGWLKERDELKAQLLESQKQQTSLQQQLQEEHTTASDKVQHLEEELANIKESSSHTVEQKDRELNSSKEQLNKVKAQLEEVERQLANTGRKQDKSLFDKWKQLDTQYQKEKEEWQSKEMALESQIKTEQKRRDRMEKDYDSELRDRDDDICRLKDKFRKSESEIKRLTEQTEEEQDKLHERLKGFEKDLGHEKQEYEDLTAKYELLEEDYVVIKAQLVMEKEQVESNYNSLKRDHAELENELRALRDTFNLRQDMWIKEKLDNQEKIKELQGKLSRSTSVSWDLEKTRYKDIIDERNSCIEQIKKENQSLKDEVEKLRRQTEEKRKMLEDYERLKTYDKNLGNEKDYTGYIKETQDLRNKLNQEERAHRAEISTMKMKYDQQIALLQDDLHALHLQNGKYRRERDTLKELLEGAQQTIAGLRTGTMSKEQSATMEEQVNKLDEMRREKEDILDKLDGSERSLSKLKTEYVTEKATWEIRIAELQTKINELEEATILQGGKSKIVGVKTKLELAWQKEREEQHRLLTESHKMVHDLKQRLLDVENARDQQQAEAKRTIDSMRMTTDHEQTKTKSKIQELQDDLLQLRDAHSKMRAFNDRTRRDKDRIEHERDELRAFMAETHTMHSRDMMAIAILAKEMQTLKEILPAHESYKVTCNGGSSIQKTANKLDMTVEDNFRTSIRKISKATDELCQTHRANDEDRIRRNLSFRKALSEDEDASGHPQMLQSIRHRDDPLARWQNPQRVTNYPATPPSMYISPHHRHSLYRKSLSLDQTFNNSSNVGSGTTTPPVWRSDGDTSGGSSTSLSISASTHHHHHHHRRQDSGDSIGLPTPSPRLKRQLRRIQPQQQGSFESDISATSLSSMERSTPDSSMAETSATSSKPAKKTGGIKEKLKKVTKSKSIEETTTAKQIQKVGYKTLSPGLGGSAAPSSPSVSDKMVKDVKGKDLKSRIANLFKKSSRSNSTDMTATGDDSKCEALARTTMTRYRSTDALYPVKQPEEEATWKVAPHHSAATLRSNFTRMKFQSAESDGSSSNRNLQPKFSETHI